MPAYKTGHIREIAGVLAEAQTNQTQVTIFCSVNEDNRNSFDTAISITGKVEKHPDYADRFRIVKDAGNYCYFRLSDINSITGTTDLSHKFKDGSLIVISLTI